MWTKDYPLVWAILSAGAWCGPARGQAPVIITIDTENVVEYQADTSDVSKYATNPNITPAAAPTRNFAPATPLGDIVAVNGQPAKGLYASGLASTATSPTPNPTIGGAIADTTDSSIRQQIFEILKTDGTNIGTIIALGMSGGVTPGSPALVKNGDWAIVGGTGAFLGRSGTDGARHPDACGPSRVRYRGPGQPSHQWGRNASASLDVTAHVYAPDPFDSSAAGRSAFRRFHSGHHLKPAVAGEIQSLFITGLGPTIPGVDPGQPFPASPVQVVNSPVEVLVNGKDAEVLAAVGYAGAADGYQVNFQVPADASGTVTIQVSAAWIPGNVVSIPVQ